MDRLSANCQPAYQVSIDSGSQRLTQWLMTYQPSAGRHVDQVYICRYVNEKLVQNSWSTQQVPF